MILKEKTLVIVITARNVWYIWQWTPIDVFENRKEHWEQKENCSDWGLTRKWGNIKPKKGLNSKKLYGDITSKRAVARKGNGVSGLFIFCFCFSKLNLKVICLWDGRFQKKDFSSVEPIRWGRSWDWMQRKVKTNKKTLWKKRRTAWTHAGWKKKG